MLSLSPGGCSWQQGRGAQRTCWRGSPCRWQSPGRISAACEAAHCQPFHQAYEYI